MKLRWIISAALIVVLGLVVQIAQGSRFSEEQTIGVLREHEAEAKTEEVCRRLRRAVPTPSTHGPRRCNRSRRTMAALCQYRPSLAPLPSTTMACTTMALDSDASTPTLLTRHLNFLAVARSDSPLLRDGL